MHGTHDYRNHYTENNRSKQQTFTQPHLLGMFYVFHHRDDDPGENHNPQQQEGEHPLTELLAAHSFDTEIKLRREIRAQLRNKQACRMKIENLNRKLLLQFEYYPEERYPTHVVSSTSTTRMDILT